MPRDQNDDEVFLELMRADRDGDKVNREHNCNSKPHHSSAEDQVSERRQERGDWNSKAQYLFATLGFSVGFGNLWRFPYLCQKNGGGAFLIPYFLSLVLLGIPVFFLELAIGQRIRQGHIGVWKTISPYLGGVGIASTVVCLFVCMYYNVIIAWCFYYLFGSFQDPLPYSSCPRLEPNCTENKACEHAGTTQYFWYTKTIAASSSIEDMGDFQWHLVLVLLLSWIVVFFFINRGVKSAGRAVFVTALMPYIILAIFFGRALALKGSTDGIIHMFKPKFSTLLDGEVWLEAATQVFFSVGVGFGTLIAMSSYNPIHNNCRMDAILISLADSFTSIFASLVVFSVLGFKAHSTYDECLSEYGGVNNTNLPPGRSLEEQCHNLTHWLSKTFQGPGLTFIAFTEAILKLPASPVWSVLFFCMLLSLGLGSMFGLLEGVLNPLHNQKLIPMRREVSTAITCIICMAVGLLFCQTSGEYWLQMFDSFTATLPLLGVSFFELIGVSWVYGAQRFEDDIYYMIQVRVGWYWKITWRFVSPLIILAIFVASLVNMGLSPITYSVWIPDKAEVERVQYPTWCYPIIVFLICVSCLCIPLVCLFKLCQHLVVRRKAGSGSLRGNFVEQPA